MIFSKLAAPATGTLVAIAGVNMVETALPVTMGMQAEYVSTEGRDYTVRVTGYKVKSCTVVPGTSVGWYKSGGMWKETGLLFPDDKSPNSSAPKSYDPVSFGLFQWADVPDAATHVKMTVVHNCDGHLEITTVGPWEIKDKGA